MPTQFLSLDIETSGISPERCQVWEVALVAHLDWVAPVESLPRLHLFVHHDVLQGEPQAFAMHARLLAEFAKPAAERESQTLDPWNLCCAVRNFVRRHFGDGRVTLAGKNLAGFDLKFLDRFPRWPAELFRHRIIDAGNLWWSPAEDDRLPDTATCLSRANVSPGRPHHALDDARAVVKLVRRAYAMGRVGGAQNVREAA